MEFQFTKTQENLEDQPSKEMGPVLVSLKKMLDGYDNTLQGYKEKLQILLSSPQQLQQLTAIQSLQQQQSPQSCNIQQEDNQSLNLYEMLQSQYTQYMQTSDLTNSFQQQINLLKQINHLIQQKNQKESQNDIKLAQQENYLVDYSLTQQIHPLKLSLSIQQLQSLQTQSHKQIDQILIQENENINRKQPILFKKQVVDQYLENRNSQEIIEKFGISIATLRRWVKQVQQRKMSRIRKFLPKDKKKQAENQLKLLLEQKKNRSEACKIIAKAFNIDHQTVYKWSYRIKAKEYDAKISKFCKFKQNSQIEQSSQSATISNIDFTPCKDLDCCDQNI